MGLFDLFGGKKAAKEEELQAQNSAAERKEREMKSAMDAHAGMEWPGFPRLNPINVNSEDVSMDETVTLERKNEIGKMIYDEEKETVGAEILRVRAYDIEAYERFDHEGLIELASNETTVWVARPLMTQGAYALTEDEIKTLFSVL